MTGINRGAVALILVLMFLGGGYLWYSQLYAPAVIDRTAAAAEAATAQTTLEAAQQQLVQAQQRIDDAKKEGAKVDDSVAKLATAAAAIPSEKLIDDASIVLMSFATRSGIDTSFSATDEAPAASFGVDNSGLQGATPIDLEFEAAGTYAEMMQFMSLVEDTVEVKSGKAYTRGRLFNIVKLQIGGDEEKTSSSSFSDGFSGGSTAAESDGPVLGPNDILFTVVVRMYTSSDANSQGVGDAKATADAAAAAATPSVDPNTGAPIDTAAGAPGADPAAGTSTAPGAPVDGAAPVDPAAASTGGI